MTEIRQTEFRMANAVEGAFTPLAGDASTTISLSGTAGEATGLTKGSVYRLWSSVNCYIRFTDGGSADADTGDMPLTAELPEWFVMKNVDRISAITSGATGTLTITEMRSGA